VAIDCRLGCHAHAGGRLLYAAPPRSPACLRLLRNLHVRAGCARPGHRSSHAFLLDSQSSRVTSLHTGRRGACSSRRHFSLDSSTSAAAKGAQFRGTELPSSFDGDLVFGLLACKRPCDGRTGVDSSCDWLVYGGGIQECVRRSDVCYVWRLSSKDGAAILWCFCPA
jgi:hypothetical protein